MKGSLPESGAEFLYQACAAVPLPAFTVDNKRTIRGWNRHIEELTGYRAADVEGQECRCIIDHQFPGPCPLADPSTPKPYVCETGVIKTKDSRTIGAVVVVDHLQNGGGEFIGGIATVLTNELLTAVKTESVPDVIYEADTQGRLVYANQAAYKVFGYTREDFTRGLDVFTFVAEADLARARDNIQRIIKGEALGMVEYLLQRKDGSVFPALAHSEVIRSNDRVIGLRGIITDYSRFKRKEESRQKRLDFIELLNSISNQFISIETDRIDTAINRALEATCGNTGVKRGYVFLFNDDESELLLRYEWCEDGISPHTGILESITTSDFAEFVAALRSGEIIQTHLSQIDDSPDNRDLLTIMTKLKIKSFINIGMFVGTRMLGYIGFDAVDKEREWDEETVYAFSHTGQTVANTLARKSAEERLAAGRASLQALLDNIPFMAWLLDKNGRFVAVNQVFCDYCGLPAEAILHKPPAEFQPPAPLGISPREREEIRNCGQSRWKEAEVTGPNGDRFYEVFHTPIFDARGLGLGFSGIARDISGRKQMEDTLRRSEAHLRQINTAKDKLFSAVAHDLRAPITSIANLMQLILDEQDILTVEEQVRRLESLRSRVNNALDLLDNLIAWAHRQQQSISPVQEEFDLHRLVNEVLCLYDDRAGLKHIELRNEVAEDFPLVSDPDLLAAVIRNLIANALKYSEAGGKVWVDASRGENEWIIEVHDRGLGIPQAVIPRILQSDSFFSTAGTHNERGSGIGLTIVRDFVHRMRGRVRITSEPNEGSTVIVSIPVSTPAG